MVDRGEDKKVVVECRLRDAFPELDRVAFGALDDAFLGLPRPQGPRWRPRT